MSEEEQTTTTDTGAGDKPEGTSLIEGANASAERIEKANAEQKALLDRQEELMARQRLGGNSNAGKKEEEPVEDTPEEYVKKVMNGEIGNEWFRYWNLYWWTEMVVKD